MKSSGCRQSCRQLRRSHRCSEPGFSSETRSEAWAEAAPFATAGAASGDLGREGANMLRLAEAQQGAEHPLSQSSRQARAVLGQF